jgi:hypothetical protein
MYMICTRPFCSRSLSEQVWKHGSTQLVRHLLYIECICCEFMYLIFSFLCLKYLANKHNHVINNTH